MDVLLKGNRPKIDSDSWAFLLINISKFLKIDLGFSQAKNMRSHASELIKWNRIINLTTIIDPIEVIVKHFIDSMIMLPFIKEKSRVLDLGSGGGFPSLPIKVMLPSLSITMVDSSRKKYSFLKHIVRVLGLKEIDIINARCEDLVKKNAEHKYFDTVMCRAFAPLSKFIELAVPFLSPGGVIIAMKGKMHGDNYEIDGIKIGKRYVCNNQTFSISKHFYCLPIFDLSRNLIFVKRVE